MGIDHGSDWELENPELKGPEEITAEQFLSREFLNSGQTTVVTIQKTTCSKCAGFNFDIATNRNQSPNTESVKFLKVYCDKNPSRALNTELGRLGIHKAPSSIIYHQGQERIIEFSRADQVLYQLECLHQRQI
ncbi:MAG: hypothetical protein AAB373_05080 [Patescibacteria group bacterium]